MSDRMKQTKKSEPLTGKAQCRQCQKYHDFPGCLGCMLDDGICCEGFIQYDPTKNEAEKETAGE